MLILADENIPLLDEFFGNLGEIRRIAGRTMTAADVAAADVLLVRSVTPVDASLLSRAALRFVGSTTIGTDHIDLNYLAARGIPCAAAPGCNAVAVGEYIATVLVLFAARESAPLAGLRLGVVGGGNTGRAVVARARALGLQVGVCDPLVDPVSLPAGTAGFAFDDLLAWADILSFHVPLTRDGPAPTWHLLDAARMDAANWRLLINTSRGPVVDNRALLALLNRDPGRRVVLDVWEEEPVVPPDLLARVWLGTPHVAGYSLEGKWRGTEQVYLAACAALGVAPAVTLAQIRHRYGDHSARLRWPGSLAALLAACCDIPADDARLRASVTADRAQAARAFDRLRRDYPVRREFAHFVVEAVPETKTPQATPGVLAALGFSLSG